MAFDRIRKALAHAFAVEVPGDLNPEERAVLEKIADLAVRRGMAVPAVMFLESVRPLNFVGSQVMAFFQPIVGNAIFPAEYGHLTRALERRPTVGLLIEMIEAREAGRAASLKPPAGR
jgi:hypothetical protein